MLIITPTVSLKAQNHKLTSDNKKAIKYYNEAVSHYQYDEYLMAIKLLEKSIKNDDLFIEAWLLLGDSYAEVNSTTKALNAYVYATKIDSLFFPAVYFFIGNLNYELANYQRAMDNFMFLSNIQNVSKELLMLSYTRLIFASTALKLVENPVSVIMHNIGAPINTINDEYINYVNTSSNYMMLTRRTQLESTTAGKSVYKEKLLYSISNDTVWGKPLPVNLVWQNDLDMGSLNLSTDGQSMYFTGCYWPMGQGGCDLYVSHSLGDEWIEPENLGSYINTSRWESQPIISSDNKKLYFASKRVGGKGGSDIWMSIKLTDGSWSPPINLGDSINTPKDEMSPFLHADGSTLFFASTGHPGLGGYDIFISRQNELNIWSKAKNIGYPTNSQSNDINIFMSIDGVNSWITSDRAGGEGNMDIYTFKNYNEILPQKTMYVEGTVVDKKTGKPLNAEIQITNLNTSQIINTTFSDSVDGKFLLVVYPGIDYAFNISKKGYLFFSKRISLKDSIGLNIVKQQFELSPFSTGNSLTMNNINFKFNEFELLPSSFIELDKLTKMLYNNPLSQIEIIGHTDSIGDNKYNKALSIKRAESVTKYLISNGINAERLSFIGMGSTMPIYTNTSEAGRAINRRTEIRIK